MKIKKMEAMNKYMKKNVKNLVVFTVEFAIYTGIGFCFLLFPCHGIKEVLLRAIGGTLMLLALVFAYNGIHALEIFLDYVHTRKTHEE